VIERLRDACPVLTGADALAEAGRDWWPLALGGAVAGHVPALPALVARPATVTEVVSVLRV
jgi:hypothetical protein